MKRLIFVRTCSINIISVIRFYIFIQKWRTAFFNAIRRFSSKSSLLEKPRKYICYLIKIFQFFSLPVIFAFQMTSWHGNHNAISDKIPETAETVFQFSQRWIFPMLPIIIINIFYYISIKLFLCAYQGFDPSLKCKGQKRIFSGHIFIKFSYLLRLCGKEIIMFQQFSDKNQEITVNHINFIMRLFCIFSQIMYVIMQNTKNRITRIKIII